MADRDFKYWAFISYSHKDEVWAKWLHSALETYRIPRQLAGRETERGKVPNRLAPIFRDRDDLAGDSDLSSRITKALNQSRFLIVLCSRHAARSKYVNEEIATFKSIGRARKILCLIVEDDATSGVEDSISECFPPALSAGGDQIQPIAPDARKDKDGKTNAKLKLIAGILGVDFDELRKRERRRRRRQVAWRAAVALMTAAIIAITYVGSADAGLGVPGAERIRGMLDGREASVLRPVPRDDRIRNSAARQRRMLEADMQSARTASGLMFDTLKDRKSSSSWTTAQTLTALFHCPDCDAKKMVPSLIAILKSDDPSGDEWMRDILRSWTGEPSPAMPAMWTAASVAIALGKQDLLVGDDRALALRRFDELQAHLIRYRADNTGGWNMFANQIDPSRHEVYPTVLALLVLLETRRAGLPWDGTLEQRDALLKATAQWLINAYDDKASPPGWHDSSASTDMVFDGLTLQVFAQLLRAQDEADVRLPENILNEIPRRLEDCVSRDFTYPIGSAAYATPAKDFTGREYTARQSIGFLWYPWAIDGAVRWLERANREGRPMQQRVRVRRALGHLVVDLGDESAARASSSWIYIGAETLFGLSAVSPQGTGLH
jgi:hypothetical protein